MTLVIENSRNTDWVCSIFMIKNKEMLDSAKTTIRAAEGTIEIAILSLVYYLVFRKGYEEGTFPAYLGNGKYVLLGVYALLCMVLFHNFEGFKFGYLRLSDVLVSQGIALLLGNFITYWQLCLIANRVISPVPMLILCVADVVIAFGCCWNFSVIYHRLYRPMNMVMIYGSDAGVSLRYKMSTRGDKYRIRKQISIEEDMASILEQIAEFDGVILSDLPAEKRNDILKFCYRNRIRAYVTPKLTDIIIRGATDICLFDTPLLLVRGRGLTITQRAIKRIFDVVLCCIAMVVAAPVMLIVAAAIKIEDGGPVFFTQKRASLNGEVFEIIKFRSMIVDAEKDGKSIPATDNDPRITKVGRFIRATRIDELPQIINILKGDMSIVGPRPERVEHVAEYSKLIPEFDFRLKVKGGLTGYAQIYGKYNTTPYDKLRLDLMYIERYSLLLDVKLILMTLRIMLKRESTEGFEPCELREKPETQAAQTDAKEKPEEEMAFSGK